MLTPGWVEFDEKEMNSARHGGDMHIFIYMDRGTS